MLGKLWRIPPGSDGVLADDPPLLPPLATPLIFASNDLVRDRGIVLTVDLGGVSFRLNFLVFLARLFPDRLRLLMSG